MVQLLLIPCLCLYTSIHFKDIYEKYTEEFKKELENHELPVKISFEFVRGSRHKFDYLNPAQTVQDDMVKYGWIEDDNAEFILPAFEQYTYDKNNPGVWIELIENEKKDNNT